MLSSLAEALRLGGVISFETRNPAARAWEHWTRAATYTERDIPAGHLREWLHVTEVYQGRVAFDAHNVFQDGRDAVYTSVLYFRTAEGITTDLEHAGFSDVTVVAAGAMSRPSTTLSRRSSGPTSGPSATMWSGSLVVVSLV